jgi:hypothetical protein
MKPLNPPTSNSNSNHVLVFVENLPSDFLNNNHSKISSATKDKKWEICKIVLLKKIMESTKKMGGIICFHSFYQHLAKNCMHVK